MALRPPPDEEWPTDPEPEPDPVPPTPSPTPVVAFHLYGLNWNLEDPTSPLAGQLSAALSRQVSPVVPGGVAGAVFTPADAPGRSGVPVLSFGVWDRSNGGLPFPTRRAALVAGLTAGSRPNGGEVRIRVDFLRRQIERAIPPRVSGSGVTGTLLSRTVSQLDPAGFRVTATYEVDVPLLSPRPTCTTTISFSPSDGNVRLDVSRLDCGDFGAGEALAQSLFDPAAMTVALVAGLILGYTAISNIGQGVPVIPLPDIRVPVPAGSVFPRTVAAGPLRFDFTYLAPFFDRSVVAEPVLRFPFAWADPVLRQPRVSIVGPTYVVLDSEQDFLADVEYTAAPVDLVSPSFEWFLDDVPVPVEQAPLIRLSSAGGPDGMEETRAIRVRAVDGVPNPVGPQLEATGSLTVTTRLRRPPQGKPDEDEGGV